MIWKHKLCITQEMYDSAKPVIYFVRFCGYFPVKVQRDRSQLFLKWSPLYATYSFALASFFILATAWELYTVYLVDTVRPWSPTDKITQSVSHGLWITMVGLGVFVMGGKFRTFTAYLSHLKQVDEVIGTRQEKWEKYLAVAKMLVGPTTMVLYTINIVIGRGQQGMGVLEFLLDSCGYLTLIVLGTVVFCNVNYLIHSLERRLRRNLKNTNRKLKVTKQNKYWADNVNTFRTDKAFHERRDYEILHLAQVYLQLCDAAEILNKLFGIVTVIAVLIAFVQVVQPIYFTVKFAVANRPEKFRIARSAVMTITRNLFGVLMIIEPAYGCNLQVSSVQKFVCRMLSWKSDVRHKAQVKIFATCLGLKSLQFSGWGFFTIDRFLVVEMLTSVVTFLFLLLQLVEIEK